MNITNRLEDDDLKIIVKTISQHFYNYRLRCKAYKTNIVVCDVIKKMILDAYIILVYFIIR